MRFEQFGLAKFGLAKPMAGTLRESDGRPAATVTICQDVFEAHGLVSGQSGDGHTLKF